MRRTSTLLEVTMSAIMLVVGFYVLREPGLNKSLNETVIIMGGAVCLSIGLVTLVLAVRSILWHRSMSRHTMPNRHPSRRERR
jgi:hypothetical protein